MRYLALLILLLLTTLTYAQDEMLISPNMLPDDTSKVRILNNLSRQLIYSNTPKAFEYIEDAIEIAAEINDYNGLAESYINYGKALYSIEDRMKAAEYYFNALSIGEKYEDEAIIAKSKNYIATVYISLGDNNIAREYLLDAIELNRKNNEENLLAANYNNIGMVYLNEENYTTALEYFFMALDINQRLGNTDWISNNYGNIGSTYSNMNNPRAVDYFTKRIELKQELEDEVGVASGYLMLGNYYIRRQMWDMALDPLSQAVELSMEQKSWELAAQGKRLLSEVFKNIRDFEAAYQTHVEYTALADSTKKEELARLVTQLELQNQYDNEQKLQERQDNQRKLRNYILGSALMASLIIVLLLFRSQREKTRRMHLQKQLLEEELDHKNRELTTNMLYLLRKNELIECISDKLIGLRKNLKKENQHVVQSVITDLRSNLDNNVWEEFEIRFKDVHGTFYDELQRDFPDLTIGEKRLCAFLRMDMSTKEISAITGQSISSLEVARTRLRKKLGISNTQIGLSQFLSNY